MDLEQNTKLAAKRTIMSAERSLMAWIRTGLSMLGFGFTLFKFLQYLQEKGVPLTLTPEGPRRIGLFLIGLGVVSLTIASIEYWETVKFLSKEFNVRKRIFPLIISSLIGLLGLLLFISIAVKIKLL